MGKKRIVSVVLFALLLESMLTLAFNMQVVEAENKGYIYIRVADAVTGEQLNGIDVRVSWGPAFNQGSVQTAQYGYAIFETDWNYTEDVLISVWDDGGRYHSKSKLVHVSFIPWVNITANVEIKLDRVTPLQSSYSGNYIVSLVQDREIVYYGESAFIVVGTKRPYGNVLLWCRCPSELESLVSIFGTGYLPLEQNITTIRIDNRNYGHFEKAGVFNLSLVDGFWGTTLETTQFTLTLKPSWGYENYQLKVDTIDAKTKEKVSPITIRVWWGSTFNNYESGWYSGQTFDLGAYPNGSVRIRVEDREGKYLAQFKEITVTEKTTTVTFELQRAQQPIDGTPTGVQLWIIVALVLVAIAIIAGIGVVAVKRRKPTP